MTRQYARSPRGERANGTLIRNRCTNTTIGAISLTQVQASFVFKGTTDKHAFITFVTEVLVATLQSGQIVVMDNLSAHQVKAVREAIEAAGCTLKFAPPQPPEFNPIEECWSKVKTILSSIGAKTIESLLNAIATAFDAVTPEDLMGWFTQEWVMDSLVG
jgi:transposase